MAEEILNKKIDNFQVRAEKLLASKALRGIELSSASTGEIFAQGSRQEGFCAIMAKSGNLWHHSSAG